MNVVTIEPKSMNNIFPAVTKKDQDRVPLASNADPEYPHVILSIMPKSETRN